MIINSLANIVNDFLNTMWIKNIGFGKILLGLFIFNFIVYLICKIVKLGKNPIYKLY